jgi:uncharacterized protein (DUF3084 family)
MPEKFKGIGNDNYLLVILVYLGSVLKGSRYKEFWRIIAREHRDGEVYMETIADVLRKEERLKREKMEKLLREEIKRKDIELELKNSKLEQKDTEIEQKDTEIEQKNTEIEQKNTEIEQKSTEIEQKSTALYEEMKNKEIALVDIVKRMLDDEMSVQMIQKITGLSNRKIEKIRQNNKID